mgnify:FL=1|jgi:hypothetical protein|tara:strand:+ start:98 stop:478 length:381 start_codon:yes stop_codon:yes gene_type:complete
MTSTIRTTNVGPAPTGTTTNLMNGLAKAWINLSGDSTISTRDSFNISGTTDHDTGEYIFAWTNAMSNINYVSSGMAGQNHTALLNISQPENEHAPTTANCQYNVAYANSSNFDGTYVGVSIYGDLA